MSDAVRELGGEKTEADSENPGGLGDGMGSVGDDDPDRVLSLGDGPVARSARSGISTSLDQSHWIETLAGYGMVLIKAGRFNDSVLKRVGEEVRSRGESWAWLSLWEEGLHQVSHRHIPFLGPELSSPRSLYQRMTRMT
jgi:hypothetical protein